MFAQKYEVECGNKMFTPQNTWFDGRRGELNEGQNPALPRPSRFVSVNRLITRTHDQVLHLRRHCSVLGHAERLFDASATGYLARLQNAGAHLPLHARPLHSSCPSAKPCLRNLV